VPNVLRGGYRASRPHDGVIDDASSFFVRVLQCCATGGLTMSRTRFTESIGALTLAFAASSCAAKVVLRPIVPEQLDVSAEQALALRAQANGVQIYTCAAVDDSSHFAWTLKGPEADLFDSSGRKIGRHYAGPTWEAFDGSKVGASVRARADSPDGRAIPWLLLAATSNAGTGVLTHVASIQRLNTAGGTNPPPQTCDAANVGAERRVPYTATYYFYSANP
jgi:FtsP/CotA-like multicopper oxidase with cupredoxin domain